MLLAKPQSGDTRGGGGRGMLAVVLNIRISTRRWKFSDDLARGKRRVVLSPLDNESGGIGFRCASP